MLSSKKIKNVKLHFTFGIKEYVGHIGPVVLMPGEFELEALAAGVLRVLTNQEQPKEYTGVDVLQDFRKRYGPTLLLLFMYGGTNFFYMAVHQFIGLHGIAFFNGIVNFFMIINRRFNFPGFHF